MHDNAVQLQYTSPGRPSATPAGMGKKWYFCAVSRYVFSETPGNAYVQGTIMPLIWTFGHYV